MKQGWALILIPGVCILVYFNSLENSFHYDDEHSIQNNIHLRALGNIPTFFVDPATFSRDADKGMYRPLLLLTYALNYAWGGYEVLGYHVVNLFLHALNACLVWWLVCAMHDRREVALLAGLLFALHPLGSEPVNYISSRSESLAAVFYLLGMAAFISGGHQQKGRILALSWVALALGLLSKSTVITLPAVLLIYDYLFISGRKLPALWRCFLRRHAPYWGIAVGYLILISANGFFTNSIRSPVRDGWTQLLTQIKAFAYYLQLLFWPLRLRVESGLFLPAVDYIKAQQARSLFTRQSLELMQQVDLLAGPTLPITATPMGVLEVTVGKTPLGIIAAHTQYNAAYNLNGFPAITVPCGFSDQGLPIGLQLAGRPFDEAMVLRAAHAYEQVTEWHQRRPPI